MHKKRAGEHESGKLHGRAEMNGSPRGRALDWSSSLLDHSYQMDDQEKKHFQSQACKMNICPWYANLAAGSIEISSDSCFAYSVLL